jgi:hypothetical protein
MRVRRDGAMQVSSHYLTTYFRSWDGMLKHYHPNNPHCTINARMPPSLRELMT